MNIEDFREYCLSKNMVEESLPFDENTLAFKLMGKIFALTNISKFSFINLKCDPQRALELRERYAGIKPGFHMNKVHWNSVYVNEDVNNELIKKLIDHSYDLILKSLSKSKQRLVIDA